jgi:peptidyl-prolyl cis-trans isomerase A (cyclophilin A)
MQGQLRDGILPGMTRRLALLASLLLLSGCGGSSPDETSAKDGVSRASSVAQAKSVKSEPLPDTVRVRLETGAGPILLELDAKRAPVTTANFVRYVDEKRLDGTSFYRAAPTKGAAGRGFVQGGIRRNYRLMLPPIEHEPTSKTGLKHGAGAISMARSEEGAGAMGEFFILTSAMPSMDAGPDKPGYAAFGRVVEGMDVVKKILAGPTVPNAGRGAMRGQMLADPVPILNARRLG